MPANRIRELRLERARQFPTAFTITQVAQRIGVNESALRRWERGDREPRRRHAIALARDFGVSVEDLGIARTQPPEPPERP